MRIETTPVLEAKEPAVCSGCQLVPISHLGLDITEPLGGFPKILAANDIEIVTDDLGRDAITREALGELLAKRREHEAFRVADAARRAAEREAKRPVVVGVPAREGLDPVAAMTSQDPSYSTPQDDYGPGWGSPTRELFDAVLAEGQRDAAARRAKSEAKNKERLAKAEARKKELLADQAKKDLQ